MNYHCFFNNTTGTDINNRKSTNMGIFLNTAKADRFSYLHETGKNQLVQLLKTDRQKPVRTGRFNFIDRTGYNSGVNAVLTPTLSTTELRTLI
jgi:hypothetical protein